MTEFDKRMTFTLNKNDNKTEDWHADWRGTLIWEDGTEYYLDAKIRNGKNGQFLSGKAKPKDGSSGKQSDHFSRPLSQELDDDIPFSL